MNAYLGIYQDAPRLDRITAEFSRLDQAAAIYRIKALADIGFSEAEIVKLTRWSLSDVQHAIGDRP